MVVRRSSLTVRARVAVLAGLLVVVALLTAVALRGDGPAPGVATVPTPPGEQDGGQPIPDPFAYDPDDEDELVRRGAAGVAPDMLEALVFLESAGREDAMAGDTEGAVGLTQILAETGQNLLGMHVDVQESARFTRKIGRAIEEARATRVQELQAKRRAVDDRYDPVKALARTARYLTIAKEQLGR